MEASGLLDAWVRPDGSAVAADGHDVLLDPVGLLGGSGLDRVLCPAVDPADVGAAAVGKRRSRACSPRSGWPRATATGSGDLLGSRRARHLGLRGRALPRRGAHRKLGQGQRPVRGGGCREQARRVRIAEVRAKIDDLTAERERLTEEARAVAGRRAVLDAELAALPGDDDLRHAHARVTAAAEAVRRARARRDERVAELAPAARRADARRPNSPTPQPT
ncbi:hypothetical protein ACR6C2_34820 [Streptomyces sp. INA 01156]